MSRSFWPAPRIANPGPVQRHSVFEWLCKHNRLRPEPIRLVRLDSEHAQSDESVNRTLPVLNLARGRDSWCWPKRSAASWDENDCTGARWTYKQYSLNLVRKYINNSSHLARKYARIFVLGHYLSREANSFPRAKLEKNCELRRTANVQGQISEHIFAPNGGYCL